MGEHLNTVVVPERNTQRKKNNTRLLKEKTQGQVFIQHVVFVFIPLDKRNSLSSNYGCQKFCFGSAMVSEKNGRPQEKWKILVLCGSFDAKPFREKNKILPKVKIKPCVC